MSRAIAIVLAVAVFAGAAAAARLPGVETPSRNISCFYVPVRPTARANLLCNIKRAVYTRALQRHCISQPIGLDWHGFELPDTKKGSVLCAGGIMYDPRDTPTLHVLPYGRTWRFRAFTCVSRRTGLTCRNRAGHGLFLSRESYRLF
jgi:Family of unknown function (DUF6636)